MPRISCTRGPRKGRDLLSWRGRACGVTAARRASLHALEERAQHLGSPREEILLVFRRNGCCRRLAGLVDLGVKRLGGLPVELAAPALELEYQLKIGLVEIRIGGDEPLVAIDALVEAVSPRRLRFRFLPAGHNLPLSTSDCCGRFVFAAEM
jgi:hypothetical protein